MIMAQSKRTLWVRWRHRVRHWLGQVGGLSFLLLDAVVLLCTPRESLAQTRKKATVGVLNLHGNGDLILSMLCLNELRQLYPPSDYYFILLCAANTVELAKIIIPADEIIAIDRYWFCRSLKYRVSIIRQVARSGIAIAIQPTYNRFVTVEDALIRATRARSKVGSTGGPLYISRFVRLISDRWYDRLIHAADTPLHELERYGEFLSGLGVFPPLARPQLPRPPRFTHQSIGTRDYAVFALDASSFIKTWPRENFAKVAHYLSQRLGLRIVHCESGNGTGRTEEKLSRSDQAIINLQGATSMQDFLALLGGARIVLTNDSAALHLATALNIPTVAIAGGGLPVRYHPYPADYMPTVKNVLVVTKEMPCFGCGWLCIYQTTYATPAPCITAVSVSRVVRATLQLLSVKHDRPLADTNANSKAFPQNLP